MYSIKYDLLSENLEVSKLICNCETVENGRDWLLAWFPSYEAKCITEAECNILRKCNAFTLPQ